MKKFFNKIGKYLILVFLLLLGLAAVGVLYLFFVPGSNLFGITYISKNTLVESDKFAIDAINCVKLTSTNYNVHVVTTESDKVSVKVLNNSFGFVKKEVKDVKISAETIEDTLVFVVTEPTGFALKNNSYIQLILPANHEVDLSLKNSAAETSISSENLKLNDLSYTTKNGNATLSNVTITGSVDLSLGNSTFTTGEIVMPNKSTSKINISLTTGKFDATNSILGDVTVKANERGIIEIKECNIFYEEVAVAGGSIKIGKLLEAIIKTSDTNVKLGEVTDNVIITLTNSGNVEIDSIAYSSDIITKQGDVKINSAKCPQLVLQTDSGNITATGLNNYVNALTTHGQINLTWADDAEHHNTETSSNSRHLRASITGNGKVVAKGVEHVDITIEGRGRAELNMPTVSGKNKISGHNGSVSVLVASNAQYALKTTSESGSVKVNLMQVPNFQGYTDLDHEIIYVNSDNDEYPTATNLEEWATNVNLLEITTKSGSLTVLNPSLN